MEKGETIIAGTMFEFYLPNGLKKLNWPKETYVEIKYRLLYDSIDRCNIFLLYIGCFLI